MGNGRLQKRVMAADMRIDANSDAKKVENSEDFYIAKKGSDAEITLKTDKLLLSKTGYFIITKTT